MKYVVGNHTQAFEYQIDLTGKDEGDIMLRGVVSTQAPAMRDYVLELLNNPPDPFKKPELPMAVAEIEFRGEKFTLRGDDRAMGALKELVQFYEDVLSPGKVKPAPVNEDPFTEIFRRLDELEKNLYAISTQPTTTQEYDRRKTVLANWAMGLHR